MVLTKDDEAVGRSVAGEGPGPRSIRAAIADRQDVTLEAVDASHDLSIPRALHVDRSQVLLRVEKIGHPAEVGHGIFGIAGQAREVDRLVRHRDDQSRRRIAFALACSRAGQIEHLPLTADVGRDLRLRFPGLRSLLTGSLPSRAVPGRVRRIAGGSPSAAQARPPATVPTAAMIVI